MIDHFPTLIDELKSSLVEQELVNASNFSINIYVAEFKNGLLTGKIKRINLLEGTVKESTKII